MVLRRDGEPPRVGTLPHRLLGVRHEIDSHLVKPLRVAAQHREVIAQVLRDSHRVHPQRILQELDGPAHHAVDVDLLALPWMLSREREEAGLCAPSRAAASAQGPD